MEAVVVSVLVPQLGEEVGPSVQRHRVQVELEDTQDPAFHKTNFVNWRRKPSDFAEDLNVSQTNFFHFGRDEDSRDPNSLELINRDKVLCVLEVIVDECNT